MPPADRKTPPKKHQRGAVAVEFALIALVFFTFVMAILEIMAMILAEMTLTNAVGDVARQIRTGQAQTAAMTREDIRLRLCDEVSVFLNCSDRLVLDVRRFESFSLPALPDPFAGGGLAEFEPGFEPGAAGDVVIVRAMYDWAIITPLMGPLLSNTADGGRLITAAEAFRNEPFGEILPSG